jgi:hypothetical protein
LLTSRSKKIDGVYERQSFANHLVLCLLLLSIPVGQLLVHTIAGSGLWYLLGLGKPHLIDGKQSLGIIFNANDNLEYISFGLENKMGMHFMSNLFTTEIHKGALFNLYFLLVGELSKLISVQPLAPMIVISFFAAPAVGFMVFRICRELHFNYATSLWAVAIVILGSDPLSVLHLLNSGLELIKPVDAPAVWGDVNAWLDLHIDLVYQNIHNIDLFPVNSFLVYPYQSAALIVQVVVAYFIVKALKADLSGNPLAWVLLSATALALYALIRPYEAFAFSALFPLTLLVTRLARGKRLLFRFKDYLAVALLVGPCLGYIVWISSLPVWNSLAKASSTVPIHRQSLVVGFGVLWFLAVVGIFRAFKEKRWDLLFFVLWALSTILLLIAFGHWVFKLAGGAVIAYGILGAFGLDHLLNRAGYWLFPGSRSRAILRGAGAVVAAILLFGTSLDTYAAMPYQDIPRFDVEVLSAAALIRKDAPTSSIPVVLTDCATAPVLVGLAGVRVYSGQWAMTPDFKRKCGELARAGFEEGPAATGDVDADHLRDLVAKIRPDFVLVRRGTWAEKWLLAHRAATVESALQRWTLLAAQK